MQEKENERTTATFTSEGTEVSRSSSISEGSVVDFVPEENTRTDKLIAHRSTTTDSIETITMRELYNQHYEPRLPIVSGLLYPGMYIFAGDPKIGKSFCMLQLAYQVSRGENFLGYDVPIACPVLYLALEDSTERLQSRLFRMFGTRIANDLHFAISADTVETGLIFQLKTFLSEHPSTRLIIIDTLQKVRDDNLSGKFSYGLEYKTIGTLKAFADEHKVCLIVVHHTRKQDAADKTETINGTNGLLGAADGAFVMYKEKRSDDVAVIELTGRDQQTQMIRIVRNKETLAFSRDDGGPNLWEEPKDELLEKVSKLVTSEKPIWIGTATSLLSETGVDMKANALSYYLNVRSRKLFSDYGIKYEKGRTSQQRAIRLTWIPPVEKPVSSDDDDRDDDDFDAEI